MMARSVIILMAGMKLIPAGCGSFAALDTKKNKTWWCFSTMGVCTTGPSGKSFRGRSYLCGTIQDIHSSWEFLWHYATPEVEVSISFSPLKKKRKKFHDT